MILKAVSRLLIPTSLLAAGVLVSAQQPLLPSSPAREAGASVSPVYEGWYDNADGTHTFLIGYYNRNTKAHLDVPVGPDNHFEPGAPDMGQPTHFLPGRRYGIFTVTVPKEWGKTQKITWSLTANGVTTSIPFWMHPDYNVSPFVSSEESTTGGYNHPPVIRFDEGGTTFAGPAATPAKAISRTAVASVPMMLNVWADDDGLYSTGTGAAIRARTPVTLLLAKYRGPGDVLFGNAEPKLDALKGGKPAEPFAGKTSTPVTFTQPGDYMLHVTANDLSGNGGGGSVCCWTTAIVKVSVKGSGPTTTGGQ